MKYSQWVDEWLESYVRPSVKEKTYQNYREIMRLHIVPYLGDKEIESMDKKALLEWCNNISRYGNRKTGAGLSAGTVGLILSILQKSLRVAVDVGIVSEQFSDCIKHPKYDEKRIPCFTLAEQKKIEWEILKKPSYKNIGALICLYTGLRIGELMALKWENVDFKNGVISVNATCRDGYQNGKYVKLMDTPKTSSSKRVIPVPRQLLPYLSALKKASKSEYVISSPHGEMSVRLYQKNFASLLKRLKIEHRSFHALRHTFATRALECGMDVKTLADILGHKNPNITLNRYAHSMMEHKIAMMNRVGQFLK